MSRQIKICVTSRDFSKFLPHLCHNCQEINENRPETSRKRRGFDIFERIRLMCLDVLKRRAQSPGKTTSPVADEELDANLDHKLAFDDLTDWQKCVIRHSCSPIWDEKLLFHVRRWEVGFKIQLTILDWDKLDGTHVGRANGLYAEDIHAGRIEVDPDKVFVVA
ncbi:hypothetical protein C8J56DRAFT_896096 [Mycena floridula]|nr:hypothetical protein C8J56DRAFT_896096 [Mycena floridula]